jgi:hypothetical protein
MLAFVGYPGLQGTPTMSSRTGNWMIAVGAVAVLLGILVLPAALSEHVDTSLLALGACGVSLGSMIAASGVFVRSRAQSREGSGALTGESRNSPRRVRGGCDVCHGDMPVIHCKVHQVHLCGDCLGQHYDFRSCAYVPSTRRKVTKTPKSIARAHGA